MLRGAPPRSERRKRNADGTITSTASEDERRDPTARQTPGRQPMIERTGNDLFDERLFTEAPTQRSRDRIQEAPEPVDHRELTNTEQRAAQPIMAMAKGRGTAEKPLRIFPFAVSRNRLDASIGRMNVPAMIVRDERDADIVITLKNAYRRKAEPVRDAEMRGVPVYVLRSNTGTQMENVLRTIFPSTVDSDVDDEDGEARHLGSAPRAACRMSP